MSGQLSDLKNPLEETADAVLLASSQMLNSSWRDFQLKMAAELARTARTG